MKKLNESSINCKIEIINYLDDIKNSLSICRSSYFENPNRENFDRNFKDILFNIRKIDELNKNEDINFKNKLAKVDVKLIMNKLNDMKASKSSDDSDFNSGLTKISVPSNICILPLKVDYLLKGLIIKNENAYDLNNFRIYDSKISFHELFKDLKFENSITGKDIDFNNFSNDYEKIKNTEFFFNVNKAFSIIIQNFKITHIFDYKYDTLEKASKLKKVEKNLPIVYDKIKRELTEFISLLSNSDFNKFILTLARYLSTYKDLFTKICDKCKKVLKYSQYENCFLPPLIKNTKNNKSYHYLCQYSI